MSNNSNSAINRRTVLGYATAGVAGISLSAEGRGGKSTNLGTHDIEGKQNTSRYVVATTSEEGTEAAKQAAEKVIRVSDRDSEGKIVVGRFSKQAINQLRTRNDIEYIEEDEQVTPPDPIPQETQGPEAERELRQRIPQGINRLGIRSLHNKGITGAGADIAIIDSGIDSDHPDLQPNIGSGKAFLECKGNNCRTSWDDDYNHGTHVAGIAAAEDNSIGVLGVAPEATLHSAKIGGKNRGWYGSDAAAAVRWVADQGFSVANMSFYTYPSRVLKEAIKYAYESGVLLVAAAGNSGPCTDCIDTPAALPEVIAVSATTGDNQLASFSSTGPEIELAAPGGWIRSTIIGGYFPSRGTSMASPHVAGAGALLMANGYSNVEARKQLQTQARDIGLGENEQGYGLVSVPDIDDNGTQGEITIKSEGGGMAVYEFVVSDLLIKTPNSSEDTVNGMQAYGWVGPDRGVDTFEYEGEITALSLNGPAQITVDGKQVSDDDYPPPPDAITSEEFTSEPGTNTVTIESEGGGVAAYEFTVTKSLNKTDSSWGDEINGTTAVGHVGPDRGTDTFEFRGKMDEFSLSGPATVLHNGEEVTPGEEDWHTLTIESDSGGVSVYELEVTDEVEKTKSSEEDSVDTNRAYGWVGPDRGEDRFRYRAELIGFELAGPATVFQNGSRVNPANLPRLPNAITSENFDLRGSNKLQIESTGGGMAAYEFSVTESIQQVDDDDQVDRNTAFGHVGPDRGTDTFQISGNVTEFTLAGPATVSVNGEIVDADSVVQASGTTTTTIETTTTETATTTTDTPTTTTTTTATEEPTTTTTTTTDTPTTTTTEEEEDSEGEETTVGNGLIGWFLRI